MSPQTRAVVIVLAVLGGLLILCYWAVLQFGFTPGPTRDERPTSTHGPPQIPLGAPETRLGPPSSIQDAAEVAAGHLARSGLSRSALIARLESDGVSARDAELAVDGIDPDWNEQAARAAQTYADGPEASRRDVIERLRGDGFTHEQAAHGADAVGL